ncbi:MAG: FAD-binding protein [Planctomycetes bacterium]|nr:FAD-binding protein [Planctomycetota bacterium]
MVVQETALHELKSVVGDDYVLHSPEDLIVFEYDGSVDRAQPLAVVVPRDTDQVSACVKIAARHGIPVIARGAGTGLSGGAIAQHGGIVGAEVNHTVGSRRSGLLM